MAAFEIEFRQRPHPPYPPAIEGNGLELRPWSAELIAQMGNWRERGFPYQAFDLGHLRDSARAASALEWSSSESRHRHFVAVEDGVAVGRCSVNLEDDNGLYIWAVHVPPEHDSRGVARRMLATLMTWLESVAPGFDFILTTNTFAEHAHRAYFALGFSVIETIWVTDDGITKAMWQVPVEQRQLVRHHIRFHDGGWQVRQHLMQRRAGAPMYLRPPGSGNVVRLEGQRG